MDNIKKICDELGLEDIGEFSDGYHTFNSLYHQRAVLFATICNIYSFMAWKSHRHADGEKCFGKDGWFVVGISTPEGQYTYHYEDKYWDMFKVKELDKALAWDGHTDKDVERLLSLGDMTWMIKHGKKNELANIYGIQKEEKEEK